MFPPVFQILKASPAVVAILGAIPKAYEFADVPAGTLPPYVSWSAVGADPQNTLGEAPSTDMFPLQLDCYGTTQAQTKALAVAVRDAMELQATFTGVPVNLREAETGFYRIALQFDYWLTRA